ncbi:hypothetical protein EXM22_04425 [Oceanispirochaeta crateris]|uniref:GAF domain-containing protein n=1 Tax=Oceanispirochaeta crateris TaxID=2518645 RepID=A0A5C1QIZ7_9SPIO|nr:hypothetical protein [Oceanispirochaeta crateris]QEN07268.1 hypothetical protein EXM22_04425 [Oceanispirochaeta crateris]
MKPSVEEQILFPALNSKKIHLIPDLLDNVFSLTGSDLAHWYGIDETGDVVCRKAKGIFRSSSCDSDAPWIEFIVDCRELLVQNTRENKVFPELLLHKKMQSALVCPIILEGLFTEIILLNSLQSNHFGQDLLNKTEEFRTYASMVLRDRPQENNE